MKQGVMIKSHTGLFLLGLTFFALTLFSDTAAGAKKKGWLGVMIQEMTPSLRDALEVGDRMGLVVTEVVEDSPADEAGLKEDDVILKFDGKPVEKVDEFSWMVRRTEPGKSVKMVIVRDGEEKEVEVTLGKLPRKKGFTFAFDDNEMRFFAGRPALGVQVQDLNQDLASYFKVNKNEGVLILEVFEDTPAEEAGLQAGDVITSIDGKKIPETEKLIDLLENYDEGDEVTVEFVRHGKRETVKVELEAGNDFSPSIFIPKTPRIYMHKFSPKRRNEIIYVRPGTRAKINAKLMRLQNNIQIIRERIQRRAKALHNRILI